ncbi:hypothetical protein D3C79_903580 [compost metagenome]
MVHWAKGTWALTSFSMSAASSLPWLSLVRESRVAICSIGRRKAEVEGRNGQNSMLYSLGTRHDLLLGGRWGLLGRITKLGARRLAWARVLGSNV